MAERIAERLRSDGVAHAVVDLDAVRQFWPTPDHDRFGFEMELRNLAPLVHNYLSGGAQRLVLAGVCETQRDRARYEEALAARFRCADCGSPPTSSTAGCAGDTSTMPMVCAGT